MAIRTLTALALAVLVGIGSVSVATPAKADCQTTCNRYGNQNICNTHCW